ncbi:MAG: hypothetical protein M1490_05740 [Candidatus Bathyarchaeota archaeon]|nr:hypothetical protein [Candidatus Bathyarchaeota archaeon]
MSVQGFPQNPVTVSGDTDAGSGGSGLIVTPEYGFTGGGVVALAICFAAFVLFVKRGKIGKR